MPISEWAHSFAKDFPPAIQSAVNEAYASDTDEIVDFGKITKIDANVSLLA